MNSIKQAIHATNTTKRGVAALYTLASLLFFALAVITGLRTVTQASLLGEIPPLALAIIALYILPQIIMAYAFFGMKRWVTGLIGTHLAITLVTAFVAMPMFNMQADIRITLVSSLMYWALLLFAVATRTYTSGKYLHFIMVPLYGIALSLLVTGRIYIDSWF